MARVILHIDMNCYFASCAVIAHPEYKGKPLVVGSDSKRGIVSTASYEARKFGINSAMPIYKAKELCKDLIIVNPDFALYHYYTNRFVNVIKSYSNIIQMASIDECYVDMTERLKNEKDPLKVIESIQTRIYEEVGLPCSIGVSTNKFLAKIASDIKKPMGITVIRQKEIKEKLWPLPIKDMFGVGKKTAPHLISIGINTIGDLANYKDEYILKNILGKSYYTLINWAHGIDDREVNVEIEDLKSIGHSRTLENNTNDYSEIISMFNKLALMVAKRAQREHMIGDTIAITIKYDDFKVNNRAVKLYDYTNDKDEILSKALELFESNYKQGKMIRLLGITLQNTIKDDEYVHQMSIFEDEDYAPKIKKNEINEIIKDINDKLGKESLKVASEK